MTEYRIKHRRGSAAAWTSANPVLAAAELGFEMDADPIRFKIGDGTTTWAALDYFESGGGGSMSAASILTAIKTVDGTGSGLDADLLDGLSSAAFATATGLSDHLADTLAAHAATAIAFTPAGTIAATTVQAAIEEVAAEAGGTTNLAYTAGPANGVVTSDTGTDATLSLAGATNAGLMAPNDFTKLAGVETAATADMTAAEILTAIKTVDGTGSGLDADLLDGVSSAGFDVAGAAATAQAAAQAASQPLATVLTNTTASFTAAKDTKLTGIATGAEVNDTAAQILTKLLTVDGTGSGLDADLLDGSSSAAFLTVAAGATAVTVADVGLNYTGTNVETVLAEIPDLFIPTGSVDDDAAFTANSHTAVPSQFAAKAYIDNAAGGPFTSTDITDFNTAVDARVSTTLIEGNGIALSYDAVDDELTVAVNVKLDDVATPDDNTDLNASITAHGLLPKLPGVSTVYLDGDGNYTTPASVLAGGVTIGLVDMSGRLAVPGANLTAGATGSALAANRMEYMPFFVYQAITIDAMVCEVTTVGSSTIARMGIYNANAAWQPGTLVYDYGTVATTTTGVKTTGAHSLALAEGRYLMVLVSDAAPVFRVARGSGRWTTVNPSLGSTSLLSTNLRKASVGTGALAGTGTAWDAVLYGATPTEYMCFLRVTAV